MDQAWDDYEYWQTQDKKTFKRINRLIKDARRNSSNGIAKVEKLKGPLSGWLSKRIDSTNRMVYRYRDVKAADDADPIVSLQIAQLRYHY